MATPALKTALWRANLRNNLGDDAYLQRQRDLKRAYRARKKLELAQQQAQQQGQQVPQVQPQQPPIQITQQPPIQPPNKQTIQQLMALSKTQPPPRPASRPSTEVIKKFISKPEIPTKPNKLKKLKLLLKQLNI
jgi:hypothetical protein